MSAYVPPVDRARAAARQALEAAETVDTRDHLAVVESHAALRIAVENLLDALDEERGETAGESTQSADPDACTCMPHRKFACGHCDMDVCQDCGHCPCGCDCAKGGE